jgi:Lon-like ATP-dependent protease
VLLIGDPGTGKSMLGRAMASLLAPTPAFQAVVQANLECAISPIVRFLTPEDYSRLMTQTHNAPGMARSSQSYLVGLAATAIVFSGVWLGIKDSAYTYLLLSLALGIWLWHTYGSHNRDMQTSRSDIAKELFANSGHTAPFIYATGLSQGALFGDVRHDPYQSGGTETPPHWLVEAGAIHKAHGGILYIDEIGGLDQESQRLLLTAIQDKALPITGRQRGSSGSMVQTNPVSCDFTLVAAGNVEDLKNVLPALRSRFTGYGYEIATAPAMPDTPESWLAMASFIAQEVEVDGRIPHFSDKAIEAIIVEARSRAEKGFLTNRLRDLGGLIRAAGDIAATEEKVLVEADHVQRAKALHQTIEKQRGLLQ